MPVTDNWRNDVLNATQLATNNVTLYDSTDTIIATVSASFSVATLGQQGDDEWVAVNVTFDNIAAGTIVKSVAVFRGTSTTTQYISPELISGAEVDRTIGPAGGRVVITTLGIRLG
jgi:hypothetical protein